MSETVETVLAIALIVVSAAIILACGASLQDQQLATYSAAQGACVATAANFDAGVQCLQTVQAVFCGPAGIWKDSGACPDGDLR